MTKPTEKQKQPSNKDFSKAFTFLNEHGVVFDRNGVSGEGFWKTFILVDGTTCLATFETFDDRNHFFEVDSSRCRVVDVFNLNYDFRGDRLADAVQDKINSLLTKMEAI